MSDQACSCTCECDGGNGGKCRHVPAGRHLWGHETMVCTRRGCGVSWEKHQLHPAECRGSTRPPRGTNCYTEPDAVPERFIRSALAYEMRYLGGFGLDVIARTLSVSRSTIERDLGLQDSSYRKRDSRAAKPHEAAESCSGLAQACEDRSGATIAPQ